MGGVRWSSVWALSCLVVLGCQGPTPSESIDLATEDGMYVPSGYTVQVPTDQAIVLLPIVDRREANVEDASDPRYPMRWSDERFWPRPVPTMIHDLIRQELEASGLATEVRVDPAPKDEDVLLSIELLEARTGREEREHGRRSVARVRMRYTVKGPKQPDGSRAELRNEICDQVTASQISMTPPPTSASLAQVAQAAVVEMMTDLDEQNVTRSGLAAPDPLGVDTAPAANDR